MSNMIKLSDKLSLSKNIVDVNKGSSSKKHTLWSKTQIIAGYGLHKNEQGISELDEVVFETENMVPIGGVQYAMEMIYGVKGPLTIPTLNSKGIGAQNSEIVPEGENPYPYGQRVCLFGVGCNGATENNLTVKNVKYNEFELNEMIPFRFTNDPLTESESEKYFGIKDIPVGESNLDGSIRAYYLKRFEVDVLTNTDSRIYHRFEDGIEGEDGSEVGNSIFENTGNEMGIESYTEVTLTVDKKDVREWFDYNGKIEMSRVNEIGLFTAIWDNKLKDYANIQLFSKLNIPTEPLSLTKDLVILYRTYGA